MMDFVPLFKALADEKRIRIAALLSRRELSVQEIAAEVELSPATVSHHLAILREAGLVEARHEQYYTLYRFRQQPMLDALKAMAIRPEPPEFGEEIPKFDQKVLAVYLVEGRLISIPTQRKKRDVILRYLAEQFDAGRVYSEKEVNQILVAYHDDVATLRRELVAEDAGLLRRDNGQYRRVS
jgi:biotin operon repressor